MNKTLRRYGCLIPALVMVLGLLTFAPRRADAADISGTVYASTLAQQSRLTGNTTIIVDQDVLVGRIEGNYDLTIRSQNGHVLSVANNDNAAVNVRNLTVDGVFDAWAKGKAVIVGIKFEMLSGTLTLEGVNTNGESTDGCALYTGTAFFRGGEAELEGEDEAIVASGNVMLTAGDLTVKGRYGAIDTKGSVLMSGGSAYLESPKGDAVLAEKDVLFSGAEVQIKGYRHAVICDGDKVDITGGDVQAYSNLSAIWVTNGSLNISDPMHIVYPVNGTISQTADKYILNHKGQAAPNVQICRSHKLTVTGGLATPNQTDWTIAGEEVYFRAGDTVYIRANSAPTGTRFVGWYIGSGLAEGSLAAKQETSFTMPDNDVSIFRAVREPNSANTFTDGVLRSSGSDRYQTAINTAELLKKEYGVEKFDTVIVASGENFPDALTGSYLASRKSAPILLVGKNKHQDQTVEYIKNNLVSGGKVYILGGTSAVSESTEAALKKITSNVVRLSGNDRYATNLAILREAGVKKDTPLLIADSSGFADALSASALGKPILLINKKTGNLTEEQCKYIKDTGYGSAILLGGTSAVPDSIVFGDAGLRSVNSQIYVERIAGENRYETSKLIAQYFFDERNLAAIATGKNFPDGLSGGPLAFTLDAPLILTANTDSAKEQAQGALKKLQVGYLLVFGGESALPVELIGGFELYHPKG